MRTAANPIVCPTTCEIIDRSQARYNTGLIASTIYGATASSQEYLYSTLPTGHQYAIALGRLGL